jgi:TfoX/Sxy family transcriptional regulator of competence genes
MSYHRMPDSAFDDAGEAEDWGRTALEAARRAATAKPARRQKV